MVNDTRIVSEMMKWDILHERDSRIGKMMAWSGEEMRWNSVYDILRNLAKSKIDDSKWKEMDVKPLMGAY